VIIIDAGGGTIDLSAFSLGDADNEFKEIAPASCMLRLSFDVHVNEIVLRSLPGFHIRQPSR
jgi:hypothetical protein